MDDIMKQMSINDALDNSILEDALIKMKNNSDDMNSLMELVQAFVERIRAAGGFILAFTNCSIESGVDNIDFIERDTNFKGNVCGAPTNDGKEIGIAFTSKDKFEGQLPNFDSDKISGGILMINTVLEFFTFDERFDGVVFNPGTDEVVMNKESLMGLVTMIGGAIK